VAQASQNQPQRDQSPSRWDYGEHVSVIGDTGSGKTFLISRLVQARAYVTILRTKPDDIVFPGFTKKTSARSMDNLSTNHILLEPEYDHQQREAAACLLKAWRQGGWTIVVDELLYIERLKLTKSVERLLTQGRSKAISTVIGMQRPVAITRFAISQSTHVFCFQLEGRDIVTMAESTSPRIRQPLEALDNSKHDFVYFNRRTRQIITGNANRLQEVIAGASGIY
jgi:hypothetical protein